MKKNLFYQLVLILTLCLAAACSSDDNKDKDSSSYAGTYTGDNLNMTVSGVTMSGKEATISDTGVLTLKNVVPGQASIDITLTDTNGALQGSTTFTGGSVSVSGNVDKSKLNLAVTIQMSNALIGTWNLLPYTVDTSTGALTSTPIFLDITPADLSVTFMGNTMTSTQFATSIEFLLGNYAQGMTSVTFDADGFMTATFATGIKATCPKGLMQYYVSDKMIYFIPNLEAIMAIASTRADMSNLLNLINQLTVEGIPLLFTVSGNSLQISITKEMIMPYLEIFNSAILPLLPTDNETVALLKELFPELYVIINSSTSLVMGMSLTK